MASKLLVIFVSFYCLFFIFYKKAMVLTFLYGLKLFSFIFSILYLLSRVFNVIKVLRLKEGKIDTSSDTMMFTGISLAYVITIIIMGL